MPDNAQRARPSLCVFTLAAVACAVTMVGCASWLGTEPVHQNKFVEHYNNLAIQAAQLDPTIESHTPAPTLGEGRSLAAPNLENRWYLTLEEALRIGLENNVIIRQNAQFMSPNNPVLQSPDSVPSIYDSVIQNAGVLFGSRGVDAANSDFDPRLTVTSKWGNDQTVQNSTINAPPNQTTENNYNQTQSRLEQQLLSGGTIALNQNWNYGLSNQPLQLFNSAYTGVLGAEFRQPLWSGAGSDFTKIAGPSTQRARGFSLVSQGIVIAHINKKLSEIDLQENLQNLTREIGDLYWDLYQNYQDYESERETSKVAKGLWDRVMSRKHLETGVDIAAAEEAYYESKAREELALSSVFLTEDKLRRLLGLPIDDPRIIYPCDVPREDELEFNRSQCLYEALINRTELTRQKTNLHSLQLQLSAARNLVAPKLDFISGAALNGFGNNFYSPNNTDFTNHQFNSAVSNLYSGKETSWSLGFEYSIPLWLRQEKAQVRQLEFRIVKARAALASQEDDIAHELNTVLMTIKRSYSISKINKSRLKAAQRRVNAARSDYEAGSKSNDLLLRALTSQTQARAAYNRNIAEYNKSLRDLLFRTGHLLTADGVSLLGIDGLPVMPPPPPETPIENLPKPSDSDPIEPKPDEKLPRRVATGNLNASDAWDVDLELPSPSDSHPENVSEDAFAKPMFKMRADVSDLTDELGNEVVPVSDQEPPEE